MHKIIVVIGDPTGATATAAGQAQWHAHRAHALLGTPGLRRVVRNDVLQAVRRDHAAASAQPVTIVEELWFGAQPAVEVLEALLQPFGSLAILQALHVREHVEFRRPAPDRPRLKRLSLLQRREDMSPAEFSNHWEHVHAPLAHCHQHVSLYVQNHALPLPMPGTHLFDGIAEFQITDAVGMQADYATEQGRSMRADVANFARTVSTYLVLAEEFLVGTEG